MKAEPFYAGRGRVRRQPLRTFKELCDELGIPRNRMTVLLGRPDAPKPELKHVQGASAATWYKPGAFRAWFAKLKAEGAAQ